MKINNKEIDMQKVVKLYEGETKLKRIPKYETVNKNSHTSRWFNETESGAILREKLRERCRTNPPKKRTKFKLTDLETGEIHYIDGTIQLANFLGYKASNSEMRTSEFVHMKRNQDKIFKKEII